MSWYRIGLATFTNGSPAVTGSGTAWAANIQAGDAIKGPDQVLHEVVSVNSDTSITIASNYTGSTAAGVGYAIIPTQGRVRALAAQVLALIGDYAALQAALTLDSGRVGLGKAPNASAKLDVNGQVWIDSASGEAALRLLLSGAGKGALTAGTDGRVTIESLGQSIIDLYAVSALPSATKAGVLNYDAVTGAFRTFIGDGTGYSWRLSKRAAGVTTDLVTVTDAGAMSLANTVSLSIGNNTSLMLRDAGGTGRRSMLLSPSGAFYFGDLDRAVAGSTTTLIGNLAVSAFVDGNEVLSITSAGGMEFAAPASPPALSANGRVVLNLTSNTNLRISARGSDGTTRVANITLA